ncbi:hypothetical protein Pan54_06140 [Rubinisphaera italica]|uniref:Uncharacterized protein n=1 Tax=Rubinisphaera italica TaxID=2527969 RepID=A0A5C5XC84_9PLAN|nr:hypothetical protein Pan54_06140 [Rubinisphaera italica]
MKRNFSRLGSLTQEKTVDLQKTSIFINGIGKSRSSAGKKLPVAANEFYFKKSNAYRSQF